MPCNMEHLVDTHVAHIFHAAVCGEYSKCTGCSSPHRACGQGLNTPALKG